jgi:hypothetical protein
MVNAVMETPFVPQRWMKDHTGMQGAEFLSDTDGKNLGVMSIRSSHDQATTLWERARTVAVDHATYLSAIGVTKQMCNRLLEPFMWHTAIVSATEWENFFALRFEGGAEIHMQKIAEMMLESYNSSRPKLLQPGDWHIPFGEQIDYKAIDEYLRGTNLDWDINNRTSFGTQRKKTIEVAAAISTMMCARTSYTVPGNELSEWTVKKYLEKFNDMASKAHWSPFEHCAPAMTDMEYKNHIHTTWDEERRTVTEYGWSGNFRGFKQYRKMFPNENRSDPRVKRWTVEELTA